MEHSVLLRVLSYDPTTGLFTRFAANNNGNVKYTAGWIAKNGYGEIRLFSKRYLLHRLAWFYVHGQMPVDEIDHINGNRADNRIVNLRLATHKQNCENVPLSPHNKSGYRGVSWHTKAKKWVVQVGHAKKVHHIGYFDVLEEAAIAAINARNELFTHHKTCYSS